MEMIKLVVLFLLTMLTIILSQTIGYIVYNVFCWLIVVILITIILSGCRIYNSKNKESSSIEGGYRVCPSNVQLDNSLDDL